MQSKSGRSSIKFNSGKPIDVDELVNEFIADIALKFSLKFPLRIVDKIDFFTQLGSEEKMYALQSCTTPLSAFTDLESDEIDVAITHLTKQLTPFQKLKYADNKKFALAALSVSYHYSVCWDNLTPDDITPEEMIILWELQDKPTYYVRKFLHKFPSAFDHIEIFAQKFPPHQLKVLDICKLSKLV